MIINADDLGLHPAVTRAVSNLSQQGALNSASVLANGDYVTDAIPLKSHLLLGAHLNILRGKPLSPPGKIWTLLNQNGRFLGNYNELFYRYIKSQLNLDEIELEWQNQIEKLLDLGLPLAHLDSEKHIHCWPKLIPIICKLARKYGIRRVRYINETITTLFPLKDLLRTTLLNRWCSGFRNHTEGIETTDFTWGTHHQGHQLSNERYLAFMKKIPKSAQVEIVCHPGLVQSGDSPINPEFGKLRVSQLWEPEYHVLKANRWGA